LLAALIAYSAAAARTMFDRDEADKVAAASRRRRETEEQQP
jgi:hypothetical protein